ncbi:MAG: UDP-N-acetylmuramoyl-L-alanyl-D-glutamate--2,6-diaminopimelate ligase [Pseudomonadota bacterium]|nr:UDP-N-acetylmuramoyl-L-alanyl-D-glutamate--2,6-diaminopimelate ligase [Pseudomonadota bacterium]
MRLIDLMTCDTRIPHEARDLDIRAISASSLKTGPGDLFAALPGMSMDGRDFISDAISRGAVAILAPTGTTLPEDAGSVILVESAHPRRTLALMAAALHGRQPETIAAVTGTNGKSSTVQFTRQIWARLGVRAASLGTLGIVTPTIALDSDHTTPDPDTLYADLAKMADDGVTHLALEASSHGLDMNRIDGVRIKVAGFTNISRDHLDYHGTPEAYLTAKSRLFTEVLDTQGHAVLNADAPEFETIAQLCRTRGIHVLGYGRAGHDICLTGIEAEADSQRLSLRLLGRDYTIRLPLIGSFQVENTMCALGMAMAGCRDAAADPEKLIAALEHLTPVRGRLEMAGRTRQGAPIFIDYAHTPDAIETLLTDLRPHTRGKLVIVMGCGGNRDRGKRPMMGALSARLADTVHVTDDNPRGEAPADIRADILADCPGGIEIGGRAEAIRAAIAGLDADDVLVIAGKGHEQGQIIAGSVLPFDDSDVVRNVLEEDV